MSENKNMQKLVRDFKRKVKEKLPEWLKEKKEHKEILRELEEHIWDKAEELSPTKTPTERTVREAIWDLGTPKDIAKEYKRRGTPKVYITEEWWHYYTKTLGIVLLLVVIGYVIGFVITLFRGRAGEIEAFNIFTSVLASFSIVTFIFVALSMEGYLPDDFKSKKQLEKDKRKIEKAKAEGKPLHPKTGKPLKPIVKPGEKIAGAIFNFIIGVLFVMIPIPLLRDNLHPNFLILMQIAGLFMIGDGVITLTRGVLGNDNISGQQVTLVLMAGLKFASIWLFYLFWSQPEIVRIVFVVNPPGVWQVTALSTEFYTAYQNIWLLAIIIQIISACYDMYKSGSITKYKQFV
jgi:hypothetical protein